MPEYSHSRVETFRRCPKQYCFKYIENVPGPPKGVRLRLGSAFHDTMEWLYRLYPQARGRVSRDVLLARFEHDWKAELADKPIVAPNETELEDARQEGLKATGDYYDRYHPFNSRTLATEKMVRQTTDGIAWKGIIDRLDAPRRGLMEIRDYKTGYAHLDAVSARQDTQLPLYALAIRERYPEVENIRLIWHKVSFDQEVAIDADDELVAACWAGFAGLVRQIEAEEEFAPKPKEDYYCDWCDYKNICPLFGHSRAIAQPQTAVDATEASGLVDRLADVEDALKSLDAEKSRLKKDIAEVAGRFGWERIDGTVKSAKVSRSTSLYVPRSGSEERLALEEKVRQRGLWERFSRLDDTAIKRAVREKGGPVSDLKDHFREGESVTVRLVNRKPGREEE